MVLKQRDPSIERSDEYDRFIRDVQEYHNKRGTVFDPQPKVGPRHVDLYKLYQRVTSEGGYDAVCDTKLHKLAWRKIAQDFMPSNVNVVQMAFLMKSAYYKNLAAYEISTFHKREPPPKEILEDVSAKGGDLLNRTLENYSVKAIRETENLGNGSQEGGSDDEHKTPNASEKMDVDEPGSTGGRMTRGLRQAPPQRVLFGTQQDGTRPLPRSVGTQQSPTPGQPAVNGTYNSNGAAFTIANYEPRSVIPSSVKPVYTPANAPDHYRQIAKKMLALRKTGRGQTQIRRPEMLPGTGFIGPNIYVRALLALQSGEPAEVRYALHHLVKISHERGDKYVFDQFPSLAEALLEQVLKVSTLFYNVKWRVSYDPDESTEGDVLDALNGTPDLLKKIRALTAVEFTDGLQPEEFTATMSNVNEAALVLRNMVMLEQNALYMSRIPLTKDFVTIALTLPRRAPVIEVQHYALEIAEQITKFFVLGADDPLYQSLLAQLDLSDRGAVVTSLRALSRISMNLDAQNRLPNVPISSLGQINDWLLVEDEELRNACLDFLYQFTAITENVEVLLQHTDTEALVSQLVRILMYGAMLDEKREKPKTAVRLSGPAITPPKLSDSIVDQLTQITDDRELSQAWLRTCFEEDPRGEITQLALWSAYNDAFAKAKLTRPLMQAKDFITNVSATFTTAQAQVVPSEQDPSRPKYTIKGVRPRAVPVDLRGRPYMHCLWQTPSPTTNGTSNPHYPTQNRPFVCDFNFAKADEMWDHVLDAHLSVTKDVVTGKFPSPESFVEVNPGKHWNCGWSGCRHFGSQGTRDLRLLTKHVKTHLPDTSRSAPIHKQHNVTPEGLAQRTLSGKSFLNTALDEQNDAAGLPLASVLVLRNLARQMGKIDAANAGSSGVNALGGTESEERGSSHVEKCFGPVKERLGFVMAWNRSLIEYMPALTGLVERGISATVSTEGDAMVVDL
ncbi:hypothetical protein FKW77_000472 [Venturia effusa]|uniref:ARID domain-containing protein n=1 Tax=Venturia effusa TaxID=50376 RepID=A0A517L8E9_9PEZI|nr:hypothetical protein FKW77_000472 [Venturia effusa]